MQNPKKNYSNRRRFRGKGRGRRGQDGEKPAGVSFDHFYSFPLWQLIQPQISKLQTRFRQFVNQTYPEFKFTYRFQNPSTAHLTISMLDLSSPGNQEKAVRIFEEEAPKFLEKLLPLKISFGSIGTFSDLAPTVKNPSLFFVELEENQEMQKIKIFGDFLIRRCIEEGVIDFEGKGGNYRFHRSLIELDDQSIPTGDYKYVGPLKACQKMQEIQNLEERVKDSIHNYPHVTLFAGCRRPKTYEEIVSRNLDELGGLEHVEQHWKDVIKSREGTVCWRDLIKEFNQIAEDEGLFDDLRLVELTHADLNVRAGVPKQGGFFYLKRIDLSNSDE